jgi:CBS domain containing-hemolysin-like protein
LRELLEGAGEGEDVGESAGDDDLDGGDDDESLAQLLRKYEATTVGGLVSEMAGHIPLPGEVVEDGPLRLEVMASTDRRVERVRVGLMGFPAGGDA